MTNDVEKTIMRRLEAKLRKSGKRTNEEVAKALNISEKTLNNYKREGCKFTPGEIYKFSRELGCSIDYLYGIDKQENREVTDVCEATGLSEAAVKQLQAMNEVSRIHTWGNEDDPGYESKGMLDLISYMIANVDVGPFLYYLIDASEENFYNIINKLPDAEKITDRLGKENDARVLKPKDFSKYILNKTINKLLDEYEPQVPACIFAASKKLTFGQQDNCYGADRGEGYILAYDRIKALIANEFSRLVFKDQSIKDSEKPTEEDWALFKEITGITKDDLLLVKEGESNEER